MMIISFAWTTEAFLSGQKTATRRFWDAGYMEMWWRNVVKDKHCAQAWDRSPRFKGQKIGVIHIPVKPFPQPLAEMAEADFVEEGSRWRGEDGHPLWISLDEYRGMMREQGQGDTPYVIKFSVVEIVKPVGGIGGLSNK